MDDWIDYFGDSTDMSEDLWTHKNFKSHFISEYRAYHRSVGGAIPWTLKEQKLLAKMMIEFSGTDLAEMITYWQRNASAKKGISFAAFYSERIDTYHALKGTSERYKWDS